MDRQRDFRRGLDMILSYIANTEDRMRTRLLLLFTLVPMLLFAQIELGPFRFLSKNAGKAYTGGIMLFGGSSLSPALSAELPAPKFLGFLDFVPGYAMRYTAIVDKNVFLQSAFISRARYKPNRHIVGQLGIGLGVNIKPKGEVTFKPDIMIGVDYLLNEKYVISSALVGGGLLISFGFHNSFGW
ncbi:hypothetical protein ACFL6E_02280 [Candidatus Neomarinimicrobiota bacterium]